MHSEIANLRQRQNFSQKWCGIRIRIFGLVCIRIRMSGGSVPKCIGCIIGVLSASVQSFRQVGTVEFYLYPTVGTVLIHSVKPELTE